MDEARERELQSEMGTKRSSIILIMFYFLR